MATCSYCGSEEGLVEGKHYCQSCDDRLFRECIRCHKPYDHQRFFLHDDNRCNSCQSKYLKEKDKRLLKKTRSLDESEVSDDTEKVMENEDVKKSYSKRSLNNNKIEVSDDDSDSSFVVMKKKVTFQDDMNSSLDKSKALKASAQAKIDTFFKSQDQVLNKKTSKKNENKKKAPKKVTKKTKATLTKLSKKELEWFGVCEFPIKLIQK